VEETWRRFGRRDLLEGFVVAGLAAGIVLIGVSDYQQALSAARAQVEAGVTVFVAEPSGDASYDLVDPGACRRMASSPSVEAAGMAPGEDITLTATWLPARVTVPVLDVSVAALRVWWPEAPAAGGLFVGPDLAEQSGLAPGSVVSLDGEVLSVAGALPDSVLPAVWRANLIRTTPALEATRAGACWYRVGREAVDLAPLLPMAAFPGSLPLISPYQRVDVLSSNPESVLHGGPSGWVWGVALAVVAAMEVLIGLAGRREAAIYRATGTRWPDLLGMSAIRAGTLVLAAVSFGGGVALAVSCWTADVASSQDALRFVAQPVVVYAAGLLAALPWLTVACSAGAVADRVAE
jgi:hypothetical protein